jgi:methylenetetrahydrofolate dehydrogenase (NADP+)/methenyltetrahydrofolate cyclohydrolase
MAAQILDGKAIARQQRDLLKAEIASQSAARCRPPGLAVVIVGHDAASASYVKAKRQACTEAGIRSFDHDLPVSTTQAQLLALIARLNDQPDVDGILVQLPVPAHIDGTVVIDAMAVAKDVDGFLPENLGLLAQRRPHLRPCTPYGVMKMLAHARIDVRGLDAVVVGQSNIVGRPMMLELLKENATVTICHSRTRDLASHVRRADLVVAATGKPQLIQGAWIRSGAIVIDVGINRLPDGRIVGDVEFGPAAERASWITPVPGGVGPMTIAMLLQNTFEAWVARTGG